MNALGERAGNVATEAAVALRYLLGIDAGIDLSRLTRVSEIVGEVAKRPVAPNKPIVGSHLFEVESGIVVHILEQMRASKLGEIGISPFPAELVGRESFVIVPGRGTGRHAVRALLEQLEIEATDEQMDEITERVNQLALVVKNGLPTDVFTAVVREVLAQTSTGSAH